MKLLQDAQCSGRTHVQEVEQRPEEYVISLTCIMPPIERINVVRCRDRVSVSGDAGVTLSHGLAF